MLEENYNPRSLIQHLSPNLDRTSFIPTDNALKTFTNWTDTKSMPKYITEVFHQL